MPAKVTLRQKPISNNRLSLYLDYYPPIENAKTGELTRREFLSLYIPAPIKFKKRKDKAGRVKEIPVYSNNATENTLFEIQVKNIMLEAEQRLTNRLNELSKPEVYSGFEREQLKLKERGEQSFIDYFNKLAAQRSATNHDNWISSGNYLTSFTGGKLKFSELTVEFCNDFKAYLLKAKSNRSSKARLANNSAVSYFNKFKSTLKQAFKEGYLTTDLNSKIDAIPYKESQRNFATIDEIKTLLKTECENPTLKKAAIFCALTGISHKDLTQLVWGNIQQVTEGGQVQYYVNFKRQKTQAAIRQPISTDAYSILGEPQGVKDAVFEGLVYSAYENLKLYRWQIDAGFKKPLKFHEFRHTYATMLLTQGIDIYTVSKMLGHKHLSTTQIYAKVIDKKKVEAANAIKLDF
jgi:site-specific recombinase XerD